MSNDTQENQAAMVIDSDVVAFGNRQDNGNEAILFEIGPKPVLEKKDLSVKKPSLAQPLYNSDIFDHVIMKVVSAEPLLSEEDILFLVKKDYTGTEPVSRRTIKQALLRNGLHTSYGRFQVYISS